VLSKTALKGYAKTAWDALFFISGNDTDKTDRWKFRRRLIYGSYRLSVFMVVLGGATFYFDTEVSSNLITGGVTLLTIIVSAYVAGATVDDKINKDKDIEP
jgi:hypothetical protein